MLNSGNYVKHNLIIEYVEFHALNIYVLVNYKGS